MAVGSFLQDLTEQQFIFDASSLVQVRSCFEFFLVAVVCSYKKKRKNVMCACTNVDMSMWALVGTVVILMRLIGSTLLCTARVSTLAADATIFHGDLQLHGRD